MSKKDDKVIQVDPRELTRQIMAVNDDPYATTPVAITEPIQKLAYQIGGRLNTSR